MRTTTDYATRLWTKKETAERLGVSIRMLDLLRQRGHLRAIRLGPGSVRFAPEDVDDYVRTCRERRA